MGRFGRDRLSEGCRNKIQICTIGVAGLQIYLE